MTPYERAQKGLSLIRDAILEVLAQNSEGLSNAEVADKLGLRSDYLGKQKDYLSWAILGLLLNDGLIQRNGRRYRIREDKSEPSPTS
jgi:uncharacterized protein